MNTSQNNIPTQSTLKKQLLLTCAVCALLFFMLGGLKFLNIRRAMAANAGMGEPVSAVTTYTVQSSTWNKEVSVVGSLKAKEGALLSLQVGGEIREIISESGKEVEKGTVLLQLDSSVEDAQLQGAEAELEVAAIEAKRAKDLGKSNIISKSELDAALARAREAKAQVDSLQARIEQKALIAPFSGKTGIRRFNIGDYVEAGVPVIPLFQLSPLQLRASLAQSRIGDVKVGQRVEIFTERETPVATAKVSAVDPQVNPDTRTFEIEVEVENLEGKLRPGMFVQAKVVLDESRNVLAVPLSSIQFAPYGDSVFILTDRENDTYVESIDSLPEQLTVKATFIRTGEKRGDFVEVLSGLKGGEVLVSSGTFRLRPGAPVRVNNEVELPLSLEPNVENR